MPCHVRNRASLIWSHFSEVSKQSVSIPRQYMSKPNQNTQGSYYYTDDAFKRHPMTIPMRDSMQFRILTVRSWNESSCTGVRTSVDRASFDLGSGASRFGCLWRGILAIVNDVSICIVSKIKSRLSNRHLALETHWQSSNPSPWFWTWCAQACEQLQVRFIHVSSDTGCRSNFASGDQTYLEGPPQE